MKVVIFRHSLLFKYFLSFTKCNFFILLFLINVTNVRNSIFLENYF